MASKLSGSRIVQRALEIVETNGYEALKLRGLARDFSVTAPALYDHFPSRDALLRAVAEQGYAALAEASDVTGDRPIDRVRSRALAYVYFAAARPELFRLMVLYRPGAVAIEVDNELGAATRGFEASVVDLERAIADGDLSGGDPTHIGLVIWAAMHGVATVSLLAPPVADAVAEDVIDSLLAGLR